MSVMQERQPGLNEASPIYVLHILEATLGGTRRYLENILDASRSSLYHHGLVYSTHRSDKQFWDFLGRCQSQGWETWEVPMVRSIHLSRDLTAYRQVRQIIRKFEPDIVHCHSSKAGGVGRLAAWLLGSYRPRIVYTPNALAVHIGVHYGIIERLLAPLTDLFVAISESEKREIIKVCGVPPERVAVVWPVIAPEHFVPYEKDEARRSIGVSVDVPLVVGVGRLSYQKDPLTFLRIVNYLKAEFPHLRAIWVGDGELRQQMEREIHRREMEETLWITGWQEDIRPFVSAADVVLITSKYESFGYVTAEALAMARPVVATRTTGTVDILLERQSGFLFERGHWLDGANAVAKLLNNPDEARAMGLRGRDHVVQFFSLERMRKSLYKAYRIILERRESSHAAS